MKYTIGFVLVVALLSAWLAFTPVSATAQRSLPARSSSNNAVLSTSTATINVGCTTGNVGDVPALIAAINQANSTPEADTIVLSPCVYTLTAANNTIDLNGVPDIRSPMTINGNGATITRSSANGTPAFRIVYVASTGNLTLNGVTISNGTATFSGGGIYNDSGTVTVTNSTFSGNSARYGAGIRNDFGTLTVTNSTFSGNTSTGNGGGGGIENNYGTVTVTNSTFSGNSASGGGGGIFNRGNTVTVASSTFSGNSAVAGGGIYNANSSTLTVQQSTISGNSSSFGGGIYTFSGSTVTVQQSTFSGNSATNSAGGIANNGGTVTVEQSTFSGNSATNNGGGIYTYSGGTVTLGTSLVAGNSAATGADIGNTNGSVTSQGSNLIGNNSTVETVFPAATLSINDVTVPEGMTAQFSVALTPNANHDIVGTATAPINPLLAPLADNGGPTQTRMPQPGSPAINSGLAASPFSTDQRGETRVQGGAVDIGAVETDSTATGQIITVKYATRDGTAIADTDYTEAGGTLTFATGVTTQTISITTTQDTLNEVNETFTVTLFLPTNATFSDSRGLGTIVDDDTAPTLSISDATGIEGSTAVFTVTLDAPSGRTVTVDYTTSDGTATAGADYPATSGTVAIAAGVTTQTVSIATIQDTLDEADETFTVTLSNATNVTISDSSALGTIVDDDAPPLVSLSDAAAVTEGGTMVFTATLSAASSYTITVAYSTTNGTAINGVDYTAASGTLTFAAGVTTQTVSIATTQDTVDEANETLTVTLSNATNATIADAAGNGTIVDDDAAPALIISDATVIEGGTAVFTVTLDAPSGQTVTVNYATSDGTATAGADYTAASGMLTFASGVTTQTISIATSRDTLDEADETFTVTLSNPINAFIADVAGNATIIDDSTIIYLPLVIR